MLLTSTVVFPPGGYIQPVDILLIDDPFYELMETIVVRATGSAQFSPETAVIYIIDTDCKPLHCIRQYRNRHAYVCNASSIYVSICSASIQDY